MTTEPETITERAREQARIALDLATPDQVGAVRSLAAAVHRLADIVDRQAVLQADLEKLLDKWARDNAEIRAELAKVGAPA